MATRDKLLDKEFSGKCLEKVPFFSRLCKYIRKKMVTIEYDYTTKKE